MYNIGLRRRRRFRYFFYPYFWWWWYPFPFFFSKITSNMKNDLKVVSRKKLGKSLDNKGDKELVILQETKDSKYFSFIFDKSNNTKICDHIIETKFFLNWLENGKKINDSLCPCC